MRTTRPLRHSTAATRILLSSAVAGVALLPVMFLRWYDVTPEAGAGVPQGGDGPLEGADDLAQAGVVTGHLWSSPRPHLVLTAAAPSPGGRSSHPVSPAPLRQYTVYGRRRTGWATLRTGIPPGVKPFSVPPWA